LRQQRHERGGRQHGCGAGFAGQPPDEGKLHERRAEQRDGLTGPNGEKAGSPVFGEGLRWILHRSSIILIYFEIILTRKDLFFIYYKYKIQYVNGQFCKIYAQFENLRRFAHGNLLCAIFYFFDRVILWKNAI
jgi:hypothetical protein